MTELEHILDDISGMVKMEQDTRGTRPDKLLMRRNAYEYLKELYKNEGRQDMPIATSDDDQLEITSILGLPLVVLDTTEQAEQAFKEYGIIIFKKEEP
jgi:hypothetical protein